MAMDFWEAKRKARLRTIYMMTLFFLLAVGVAILIEYVVRMLYQEGYTAQMPYLGFLFLGVTFCVALFYYMLYSSQGGSFVAESLGGKLVAKNTPDYKEKQLLNIVEEMSVASGIPMPPVYLLPAEEINAFAAGVKPSNAAIAVTKGALNLLTRDELQGVIAHEFGHIVSYDMKINMRLAAMLMGFFIVLYLGLRLLQGSVLFGRGDRKGGNPVALIALIFLLAGVVTWVAGAILRSMVSRQREYHADASAVQYTRNSDGLIGALKKIGKLNIHDMPKTGMAYSHLYFDNHSMFASIFATHPPIEKRIKALKGL